MRNSETVRLAQLEEAVGRVVGVIRRTEPVRQKGERERWPDLWNALENLQNVYEEKYQ